MDHTTKSVFLLKNVRVFFSIALFYKTLKCNPTQESRLAGVVSWTEFSYFEANGKILKKGQIFKIDYH